MSIITPVLNRVETMSTCLASSRKPDISADRAHRRRWRIDGWNVGAHRRVSRLLTAFDWVSEPDNGMYDAINKGIALAQGDVFAYLNSDDLYFPWSVEVAVRALSPGIELIYGDLAILEARPEETSDAFYIQFYPDFDLRHYSYVGVLGQPTVFWRRDLTEEIGLFDNRYRLIGDCDYWLRAAMSGANLRHVPEVMAVQTEHATTLRATQGPRLREEFDTLRQAMTAVIEPPSSLRWERLTNSVVWRARQLEFFLR